MAGDLGVTPRVSEVPELGPLLGRFASGLPRGPAAFPLDDLRFRLLGGLYQRAGAARRELEAGQPERALAQLSREAWLELWREAAGATGDRLLAELDRRLAAAREVSRMPPARLAALRPSDADRRTLRARLDAAGIPLERIEPPESAADLRAALLRAAMALDASWDRLGSVAVGELAAWDREVARVRAWRRSRPLLWVITGTTIVIALALGLSLGGYLPAPGPLGALQRWFWSLPWR